MAPKVPNYDELESERKNNETKKETVSLSMHLKVTSNLGLVALSK